MIPNFELEALVLWVLHDKFNFGPKRLKRFHDRFTDSIKELVERYGMDESDNVWLCTKKLKDRGIDIEAWRNENNGGEN